VWLYLIEKCFPHLQGEQAPNPSQALFEQLNKKLFSDLMGSQLIAQFRATCTAHHNEMSAQF
jgi:hypothetical protein